MISSCHEKAETSLPTATKETTKDNTNPKKATEENLPEHTFSGVIVTDPNEIVSIHTPIAAIVSEIKIKEGQAVKKGQILAYIEHRNIIAAQKDYLQAKALYHQYQEEFQRKSDLYKKQAIAKKEWTDSEAKFLGQKAEYLAKKADLQLIGIPLAGLENGELRYRIEIRAKENGNINHIWVHNGEFIGEEKTMFEIINSSKIYLKAEIFSNSAKELSLGDTLEIKANNELIYTQVDRINPSIDPNNQILTVYSKPLNQPVNLQLGERVFTKLIKK